MRKTRDKIFRRLIGVCGSVALTVLMTAAPASAVMCEWIDVGSAEAMSTPATQSQDFPASTPALAKEACEALIGTPCNCGVLQADRTDIPATELTPSTNERFAPQLSIPIPGVSLSAINLGQGSDAFLTIPWIGQYVSGVYTYAVSIAGILAGVMIVVGGFQILTAGGDATRYGKGKQRITDALVGLLLVFSAYLILNTVSPSLTNLEAIRIPRAKKIPFVKNETPPAEAAVPSSSAPAIPSGPLTPTAIAHFAQCGSVGRSTPYLAKGNRCAKTPDGSAYNLCTSGCGVASATMVIASLTGRDVNGLAGELATLSSENNCRPCNADCSDCSGTSEDCLVSDKVIGRYGLKADTVADRDGVIAQLQAGHPVVALYQPSIFTKNGHYIVISAVNPDGTIRVLDPGKGTSPYNYNCEMVRRSSATAPCPLSSDHLPADIVFGRGFSGGWVIQPK